MNKHININNVNMGSTIGMMFVSAFSPTGGDDRGTSGHKGVRAAMRVAPASFKMSYFEFMCWHRNRQIELVNLLKVLYHG